MRRRRAACGRPSGEAGAAILEFIVIGVGVLVPLLYLALCVATVQSAAFASAQAVREAGRAFGSAPTAQIGRAHAAAAAALAFADHGLQVPPRSLRLACPDGPCLTPGSVVDVTLAWSVPLPWLPSSLSGDAPVSVPITATHRAPVDDYRGSPVAEPGEVAR